MPKRTLSQLQAALSEGAADLMTLSALFDESVDEVLDQIIDNDDYDALSNVEWEKDTPLSEILELAALSAAEGAVHLSDTTRGPYTSIPRSRDFFSKTLQMPDKQFRHRFRVSRDTFDRLVALLADDPVFQSKGKKPQRHVKYQLACWLWRYGALGSSALTVSIDMSIGEGTVHLYCRRVTRALRRLRPRFFGWPDDARKVEISAAIEKKSEFSKCIGSGDGSLIRLLDEPEKFGWMYRCRKKFYAVNIQATVDHEGRFTSNELGWTGSATDAKVWKSSDLFKNRGRYFRGGYYIMVDKGYPSSPYVLRPFDEVEVASASKQLKKRMRHFNKRLSKIRIVSEHAFGRLKGRFRSLKAMGTHRDMHDLYRVVDAMMVVHNICIAFGDRPEQIPHFSMADIWEGWDGTDNRMDDSDTVGIEVVEGEPDIPAHETERWLMQEGRRMRKAMLNELFPAANYQTL